MKLFTHKEKSILLKAIGQEVAVSASMFKMSQSKEAHVVIYVEDEKHTVLNYGVTRSQRDGEKLRKDAEKLIRSLKLKCGKISED